MPASGPPSSWMLIAEARRQVERDDTFGHDHPKREWGIE
jgi:hypothetical protein